jgi:hypothetical protein
VASVPQAFYGNESCEENIESDEGGEIYIEYGECEEVEINDYATHAIDFSEEVHPNRLDQVWHHDDSNQCCDGGAHVDRLGRWFLVNNVRQKGLLSKASNKQAMGWLRVFYKSLEKPVVQQSIQTWSMHGSVSTAFGPQRRLV